MDKHTARFQQRISWPTVQELLPPQPRQKMVKVWRIENSEGYGMYRSAAGSAYAKIGMPGSASTEHPMTYMDSEYCSDLARFQVKIERYDLRYVENDQMFGFVSLEQLFRWMYCDDWLVKLGDLGFVVNEYLVARDFVIAGRTQCTFLKGRSTLTQTYHPGALLEYWKSGDVQSHN